MITYYPELYTHELFYSGNARFAERSCYPTIGDVNSVLFGKRSIVATVELPSHLEYFCDHLPPYYKLSFEELVIGHTLFPYYGTFMPRSTKSKALNDMLGNGNALHMRAGLMASKLPTLKKLRYCQDCVDEDRKTYGEAYWHSLHQIPGILVCPTHHTLIRETDAVIRQGSARFQYFSAESRTNFASGLLVPEYPVVRIFHLIAQDAAWLLDNYTETLCLEFILGRYQEILEEKGYKKLPATKVARMFSEFYGEQTLEMAGCPIDENSTDHWLTKLIRGKLITHNPVRHLLFIRFLGYSFEDFLQFHRSSQLPIGLGPWPCQNPVCPSFQKKVIHQVELVKSRYIRDGVLGILGCKECEYIYRVKIVPGINRHDLIPERIVDYGSVWKRKLSALWNQKDVSLRSLARKLGVDTKTIQAQAALLGLKFPRPGSKALRPSHRSTQDDDSRNIAVEQYRKTYRMVWEESLQNSDMSTTELRKLHSKEYAWLYRHDRNWLVEHKPKKAKQKSLYKRIDWAIRDKQIAVCVEKGVMSLISAPGKPKRLTITSLSRTAGYLGIVQQHLDKLPSTKKCLFRYAESREAFAIRKIGWARKEFLESGFLPSKWQIIKKAGIERLKDFPRIKQELEDN